LCGAICIVEVGERIGDKLREIDQRDWVVFLGKERCSAEEKPDDNKDEQPFHAMLLSLLEPSGVQ
jgi:hypothetical protein